MPAPAFRLNSSFPHTSAHVSGEWSSPPSYDWSQFQPSGYPSQASYGHQGRTSPQPTQPGVVATAKGFMRNGLMTSMVIGGVVSLYLGLGPAAVAMYLGARVAVLGGASTLAACKPEWTGLLFSCGTELLNVGCLSAVAGMSFFNAFVATCTVLSLLFCVVLVPVMLLSICGVGFILSR